MYILGLDIGVTSVGHAILELDSKGEPFRMLTAGSRIFTAAEQPKTGESLALPRRTARGARRRNRRHVHRLERIKNLLQNNNIYTKAELEQCYKNPELVDIYAIRCEALNRKLTNEEFARLLVHLAQRRGFKSNRKADAKDKEAGAMLNAIKQNQNCMTENDYRTVGEMLYKDNAFSINKRNKSENYRNTVSRDMILDEIKFIFSSQRSFDNAFATQEFESNYIEIFSSQRSFEEGPGDGSPFGGNQIEKMVGKCTFCPDEPRAAKATYTFEKFNLLQKINNISIVSTNEKRDLNNFERKILEELAHQKENLSFIDLRKALKLTEKERFNLLTYGSKPIEEVEKTKFQYLKAYHTMRKIFNKLAKNHINNISIADRDEIGRIFTYYKTDATINVELAKTSLNTIEISTIQNLDNFNKMGNLSILAMQKITPHLEQGLKYNDACEAAGFAFKGHTSENKNKFLPPLPNDLPEVTSPVVKRSIQQTILVINAIIKKYGSPAAVRIELAREVSKNFSDRKKIEKEQEENFKYNEKIRQDLRDTYGVTNPNGQDVLKLKLWQEQAGVCAYTRQTISCERLFEVGYCEIDHIVPYSWTFNDKFTNKVLVMTSANREKKNRLPLQYIKDKDSFIVWVNTNIRNLRKRENLLKTNLSPEEMREQKDRNLTDTQHITRFVQNYLQDNLIFDENYAKKKRVMAVNGRITAYMRNRWGIRKIREDGDLHHAVDATIVACITDGHIQKVTSYMKARENEYSIDPETGEVVDRHHFPLPWKEFRTELECRFSENPAAMFDAKPFYNYSDDMIDSLNPFFVSRMKRKKVTGSAHKDTIRSGKEQGFAITKTALTSLKLNKEKDAIADYYRPESDRLLYELLLGRLLQFDGDAKKAFEEPVYKPSPDGGTSPLVKKVKICEKMNVGVSVNDGIAGNGDMLRIDVFYVEKEGYYFVLIYVADMVKDVLPNRAVVQGKLYENWKEMNDSDFIFSLYPNDLIRVTAKKPYTMSLSLKDSSLPKKREENSTLLYYRTADISTASVQVVTHDNAYFSRGLGIKSLLKIEKYTVDVLGNYQICGKEIRSGTLK